MFKKGVFENKIPHINLGEDKEFCILARKITSIFTPPIDITMCI